MKRFILTLFIISLLFACKSRKVTVDSYSNDSKISISHEAKVSRSVEASVNETSNTTTISDTANESRTNDGLEFEADSVSYNANTGELKFKPKGKVKFNRLNQSKSVSNRKVTDTTHRQADLKSNSDSVGKIKAAASTSNKGKHKQIDATSDVAGITISLLIAGLIGYIVYKKVS